MKNLIDKIFIRKNNLENISEKIKDLSNTPQLKKIFDSINSNSETSEIRLVGGCIRKILNNEEVDDIDLATNLEPNEVSEVLMKNQIDYYETGIKHGTITAIIDDKKFEILFITALITPLASTPGCLKKFLSSADKNALITFFGIELNGTNTLFSCEKSATKSPLPE